MKTKFKQTETCGERSRKQGEGQSRTIGKIPEGWGLRELGSLSQVVTGKTPPTKDSNNFGLGYSFITPRDMHGQKYIRSTERYLTERGKDVVRNCLLPADSICVSCIGSDMGKVVMTDGPSITNQQLNSLICDQVDPHFVYYGIINIADKLRDAAFYSTAVPILNKSAFSHFKIPIPKEKSEQHAIAKILSGLDEKIELNHQMNKTLESIAQAIFKRWFVDFEFPYKNGKPYKSSGGKLVDSELGEIPEGWKVASIGDILELAYGKGLRDGDRSIGNVAVYGSNGQIGWHDEKLVDGPGIVVGRKGNPGIIRWVQSDFYPIDTTFYVVPHGIIQSMYYLFYMLESQNLVSLGADSAVPGLNRNIAYMNKVVIPPEEVLEDFDGTIKLIFTQIQRDEEESRTLSQIRDSLLPRLMSGKIRVNV